MGFSEEQLEQAVKSDFEHETGHLIPILGASAIRSRLGIRFYKATFLRLVTISALQPEIEYKGHTTVSERIDVTTNVNHLSPADKAQLKKALEYAKKLQQSKDKSRHS